MYQTVLDFSPRDPEIITVLHFHHGTEIRTKLTRINVNFVRIFEMTNYHYYILCWSDQYAQLPDNIYMLGLLRMSELMCTDSTSSVDRAWKCIPSRNLQLRKTLKKIPTWVQAWGLRFQNLSTKLFKTHGLVYLSVGWNISRSPAVVSSVSVPGSVEEKQMWIIWVSIN